MSQDTAAGSARTPERPKDEEEKQEESSQAPEQRQKAWEARQDLVRHAARTFASTLVEGDQFGQTGGTHNGDKIFHFGGFGQALRHGSGPVSSTEVDEVTAVFRAGISFDEALTRLRAERVVVLSGGQTTGRRSAALMLLSRLGIEQLRDLEPPSSPVALLDELDSPLGYVLCDWTTRHRHPLRTPHLSGLREQLERGGGHLVITVEPSTLPPEIPSVRWEPPPTPDVLHAHVTRVVGEAPWTELSGLPYVKEFLEREHPPYETAQFARHVVALHRGEIDERQLAGHGEAATLAQIDRWLTGETPNLFDKAFLVSLSVFDGAPYAVAAELGDQLFKLLHRTENPDESPRIPVFGTSRSERLQLARARGEIETELTESGVVGHFVARFQDERIAPLLLREVWNLHPSARQAIVGWIRQLAKDRRPLVRTRAAGAAALFAQADFPSALAHLIEPWADSNSFNAWLIAANALTLSVLLEVAPAFDVLHDWCTGDHHSRRWTAIRAYGLLGTAHHETTLRALLDAVRRPVEDENADDDEDEAKREKKKARTRREEDKQLADALELLLLTAQSPVLHALAERLDPQGPRHDRAVRSHSLRAFVQACDQYAEEGVRPIVLDWYARALASGEAEDVRHLTAFWSAVLGDQELTSRALRVLRGWVLTADRDRKSEVALTALLPALAAAPGNHQRITHLLRTVRDADENAPPVADRLGMAVPAV
ncbi:hypothetical protein IHE56_11575 [Streptomyces sp. ID01-12c]|uniref:hypothetical protein n=1 Tax=Streptomyces caniscabiei TaxID=2746961 RepID=UPI00177EE8DA|nr:hypothetical protein [Streptomyces caniscabiei]MBD9702722.1 hypothetical protein [Streptomyces caniscabiei]MDX3728509.1 hypothetical protein [Streptomyces caniscabiei]